MHQGGMGTVRMRHIWSATFELLTEGEDAPARCRPNVYPRWGGRRVQHRAQTNVRSQTKKCKYPWICKNFSATYTRAVHLQDV